MENNMRKLRYTYQYFSKYDNSWQNTPSSFSRLKDIKSYCNNTWTNYRILDSGTEIYCHCNNAKYLGYDVS